GQEPVTRSRYRGGSTAPGRPYEPMNTPATHAEPPISSTMRSVGRIAVGIVNRSALVDGAGVPQSSPRQDTRPNGSTMYATFARVMLGPAVMPTLVQATGPGFTSGSTTSLTDSPRRFNIVLNGAASSFSS